MQRVSPHERGFLILMYKQCVSPVALSSVSQISRMPPLQDEKALRRASFHRREKLIMTICLLKDR